MTKLSIFAACAAILTSATLSSADNFIGQGGDGNPHNWDRQRRCDHVDYSPVCGPCEGYGGIPFGDKNEQIKLTTCEVVAGKDDIAPEDTTRPVWGRTWTTNSWEVLIGVKTDPFCFQAFPGNSSAGNLCYRPQTGVQVYDFADARALREDLQVKTPVGNITTSLIHQGKNFWVVNKLPWYAAGIHQCVCTQAREGGAGGTPQYPIATTWTDNLSFVGLEKIAVEYDQGTHTLEHWAFGPHHVWSFPKTGKILRMWQPFNGLQVFPDGANDGPVDPELFKEIPPAECKKGGAIFRIKCDDDGYPITGDKPSSVSVADINRANQIVPGPEFKGENFGHMSDTLNNVLLRNEFIKTRPCEEWGLGEIQDLQSKLYLMRDDSFDAIYHGNEDRRRLSRTHTDIEDLQSHWDDVSAQIEGSEFADDAESILRDGHCHEAVMWYVHHMTQDIKEALGQGDDKLEIPLLSENDHHNGASASCSDAAKMIDVTGAIGLACGLHEDKVSCASCHSDAP